MGEPSTGPIADDDLVLTLICRESAGERAESSMVRWFDAGLSREHALDGGGWVSRDLADTQLVWVSLEEGIDEAFLQVDTSCGDLAAPMEDFLQLEHTSAPGRAFTWPRAVLIVDQLTVREAERGQGLAGGLLREVAAHFAVLTGAGLILAYPAPAGRSEMDPFTLRSATRGLQTILTRAGLHRIGTTGTWWARYETVAANGPAPPQPTDP